MTVKIWTDGACSVSSGVGGWGCLIERKGDRVEYSGGNSDTTNNIMELTACIEALKHTSPGETIEITSDSQYVVKGITEWISNWKRKGWQTSSKKPVLNQEYWKELDRLCRDRNVTWHWVRGHAGHPENERCDELAVAAARELK